MKGLTILENMYQDLESRRTCFYQKASRVINNPDAYDTPKKDLEFFIEQIIDAEKRQSLIMFFAKQYEEPSSPENAEPNNTKTDEIKNDIDNDLSDDEEVNDTKSNDARR